MGLQGVGQIRIRRVTMTGSIVTVTVSLLLLVVCQVDGNDGQIRQSCQKHCSIDCTDGYCACVAKPLPNPCPISLIGLCCACSCSNSGEALCRAYKLWWSPPRTAMPVDTPSVQ
ncbi:hypothetical protein LSAT2_003624 [Lamellibrachia satsuma]|nr:hypothetical protein LSAT2_003624 [Lamellibrachia satsuma]